MSMLKSLYAFWLNSFYKAEVDNKDPYKIVLCGTVAKDVLYKRYNEFTEDGIEPIESLPEDKRNFFWDIAKRISQPGTNNYIRIRTAKAAYALSLIVSTD